MILNYDDNDKVLQFLNSRDAGKLGAIGAACPDHLVHTKRTPLLVDWNPATRDVESLKSALAAGVASYNEDYQAYFDTNKIDGDVMSAPPPRVILIPGVGLVSTGKTKAISEVSTALYNRAIAVMTGSTALGNFVSGIRVNSVLPDAVLSGSAIWNSGWRNERVAAYGIAPDQLEEYYRKRTTLLVNILPEDIANSIAFLAGSQSSKTTGCFVTVDGGVPAAFAR